MKKGNDLWRTQIQEKHMEMPTGTHPKETEIEVFRILYERMVKDGMTQAVIREHFKESFDIRYSAFYSRLRKVEAKHVI